MEIDYLKYSSVHWVHEKELKLGKYCSSFFAWFLSFTTQGQINIFYFLLYCEMIQISLKAKKKTIKPSVKGYFSNFHNIL